MGFGGVRDFANTGQHFFFSKFTIFSVYFSEFYRFQIIFLGEKNIYRNPSQGNPSVEKAYWVGREQSEPPRNISQEFPKCADPSHTGDLSQIFFRQVSLVS